MTARAEKTFFRLALLRNDRVEFLGNAHKLEMRKKFRPPNKFHALVVKDS